MSVIEMSGVRKSFHGRTLYSDVNFDIPENSVVALSGPNGAGKSVLLRLMCGFMSPDDGVVTINPRYLSHRRTFPEKFGVIIDGPGYVAGQTGRENLQELARIRHVIGNNEIDATMRSVGLDPELRQAVRHYSLGMKQKLALAQALMESPEVLILDEPFNALDDESVQMVTMLLRQAHVDGATIVFTSHDRHHIDDLATTEMEIANTRVVQKTLS
jgi:ABC-2 type transport system ATP-binding protein